MVTRTVVPLAVAASLMLAAPAAAAPGTVRIAEGDSVLFRAGPSTDNVLLLRGEVGVDVWDFAAPVNAGPGCMAGVPVHCSVAFFSAPDVRLHDGDDRAFVAGTTVLRVRIDGGGGDDDFHAGAFDTVHATGGDGDDTIRLNAQNGSIAYGGGGSDRIAGDMREGGDQLHGGSGDDLLVPSGSFGRSTAFGEGGRDRLVHDPNVARPAQLLDGGDGADVIAGRAQEIAGGGGADVIAADTFSGLGTTVSGGGGGDVIDVSGDPPEGAGADTVDCGNGADSVYADAGDAIAANCEDVVIGPAPALAGVAQARADAAALLEHQPAVPLTFP